MKRALIALATALALTGAAGAHVTVSPPFVEASTESILAFEVANERPPRATVAVRISAPPGISIVSAAAPSGWRATMDGSAVTWTGGRLEGTSTDSFSLRALTRTEPGTQAFTSVQTYDDGAVVRWQVDLNVLPATGSAPKQHPWGALAAALAGTLIIAASLFVLRQLRRRPLQDQ